MIGRIDYQAENMYITFRLRSICAKEITAGIQDVGKLRAKKGLMSIKITK
jgi:hypothetical protein